MEFRISDQVFEYFPNFCVAVVAADGLDNTHLHPEIMTLLQTSVNLGHEAIKDTDIREHSHIKVWRDAFEKLSMNPNRFPSSIEALAKRVAKKPDLPVINNIVNLTNAMAVRYWVPMGSHDVDRIAGNIEIRFTGPAEPFTPFGSSEAEIVEEGELVYADDQEVRTRKWVWRQGEHGKVDDCTRRVFFPIDGFEGITADAVRSAQHHLETLLKEYFPQAMIRTGWVDRNNKVMTISE
jgi:DNA/RNA-binding domain of Phe-tRNA-synthetase-like protein